MSARTIELPEVMVFDLLSLVDENVSLLEATAEKMRSIGQRGRMDELRAAAVAWADDARHIREQLGIDED